MVALTGSLELVTGLGDLLFFGKGGEVDLKNARREGESRGLETFLLRGSIIPAIHR
jgi:hypothetical protein